MTTLTAVRSIIAGAVFAGALPFIVEVDSAQALSLTIPTTTVNGNNVFSGPSFTVTGDYAATDSLNLAVSGAVNIDQFNPSNPSGYTTNAAGVLLQQGGFISTPAGTANNNGSTSFSSLLLGNAALGFRQLFLPNAANGLGSSAPPTDLTLNATLGSIFGTGLSNGTVLEFRISDTNTFDNIGAFTVSSITPATAVPTPALLPGLLGIGIAALRKRRDAAVSKLEPPEKQANG